LGPPILNTGWGCVWLTGSDQTEVVSSVCGRTEGQNARSPVEVVWKEFMDAGMLLVGVGCGDDEKRACGRRCERAF